MNRKTQQHEWYADSLLELRARMASIGVPFVPGMTGIACWASALSDDELRRICGTEWPALTDRSCSTRPGRPNQSSQSDQLKQETRDDDGDELG